MSVNSPANRVQLILGGSEVFIVESYAISMGMLAQPCAFAIELGNNVIARDLMRRFPPNTPFALRVGEVPQFQGRTDGWTVNGGSDGTTLLVRGRDCLAQLTDAYVDSERSFSDVTFTDLTGQVMDIVIGAGKWILLGLNDANRKVQTGASPKVTEPAPDLGGDSISEPNGQQKTLQAKMGTRWLGDFLKPQYDRGGLFLIATSNELDNFILSTANANQSPLYRIRHARGAIDNVVKSVTFKNEPTARYSSCEVWGRRGGGNEARKKVFARIEDPEMIAFGFKKPWVIKDDKSTTVKQAEFLAKRKMAEARRATWSLSYTVSGHTTPTIEGNHTAVWARDTVVEVDDQELGLQGPFYVESVEFRGAPQAETTLNLMRPEDVIFAEEAS
jgi:prophage tail gpP-like protein